MTGAKTEAASAEAESTLRLCVAYRRRRLWRNVFGVGASAYAMAILWIPGLEHRWAALLGLIGTSVLGALAWMVWRCPACNAPLERSWRVRKCLTCRVTFVPDRDAVAEAVGEAQRDFAYGLGCMSSHGQESMAVWQVEFTIVPRRAFAAIGRVPLSQLLDTNWWSAEHLPSGHERQLGAIAPSGAAASPDIQSWGVEDGNRIDVWLENGKPARMVARVDVRRLDATFGAKLLQFARTAGALLVRRDGLVIEPTAGAFGAALRTSDAWKYTTDPAASLASWSEADEPE